MNVKSKREQGEGGEDIMNTELAASESSTTSSPPKKEITDISSMLLPVEGRLLLLPGVSVAEIVGFVPPEHDETDMPSWYLGTIHWRNQRVPLVSYEMMTGGSQPFISSHCRIAVMNNTGLSQQLDFFAMLLQATPKLLRLKSEEVKENSDQHPAEGEKMHVLVSGEKAVIPDTQFMERTIIQHLQIW
jgi:chemosensory pili system protein ChpC